MKPKYSIGQWIRFYRNGELVLGVIAYTSYDPMFASEYSYQTDKGEVTESRILEAR